MLEQEKSKQVELSQMLSFYAEVISDNRITIPQPIVKILNLQKGDTVKIFIEKVAL